MRVLFRLEKKGFLNPKKKGKLALGHDPQTISERYKSVALGLLTLSTTYLGFGPRPWRSNSMSGTSCSSPSVQTYGCVSRQPSRREKLVVAFARGFVGLQAHGFHMPRQRGSL